MEKKLFNSLSSSFSKGIIIFSAFTFSGKKSFEEKIYAQALSDFTTYLYTEHTKPVDTLFIGNRKNGTPDDFPNITLPKKINQRQK